MEGVIGISPKIKKIDFKPGKIIVNLEDGREIVTPLKYFPSIRKLNSKQRKHWYLLEDRLFSFDECDEIFHIEQVLGKEEEYRYKVV